MFRTPAPSSSRTASVFFSLTAQRKAVHPFSSCAPSHRNYEGALEELKSKLDAGLAKAGLKAISLEGNDFPVRFAPKDPQKLVAAYGDDLLKIGGERKDEVPETPGHSHQSVRDISLLGSIPGMTMVQPANEKATRLAVFWAVEEITGSTYIRLEAPPQEDSYTLPIGYVMKQGWGLTIKPGKQAALIAYGPTGLQQAFLAGKLLAEMCIDIAVINLP